MTLATGINHVAIITADLDRFIEFYSSVFEMDVTFRESTPAFDHAILRMSSSSWLHPAKISGNAHGNGLPDMFTRGHLDHLALTAPTLEDFEVVRERLVDRGATGGVVEDLGAMQALWFRDPDGMSCEVCLVLDPELRSFHAPRPLSGAGSAERFRA